MAEGKRDCDKVSYSLLSWLWQMSVMVVNSDFVVSLHLRLIIITIFKPNKEILTKQAKQMTTVKTRVCFNFVSSDLRVKVSQHQLQKTYAIT